MSNFKSQKYKERLLAHYRDLIYFFDWFWKCEHKNYTNKELLEWVESFNKREEDIK